MSEDKVINLSEAKEKDRLDESFLRMFGSAVKSILKRMFGASSGDIPFKIKGSEDEIESFMKTVKNEKDYMDAFMRYGLDDPETLKRKGQLEKSIKRFERKTGLEWPFE